MSPITQREGYVARANDAVRIIDSVNYYPLSIHDYCPRLLTQHLLTMSDSPTNPDDRRERFLALLDPAYKQLEQFCFAMERDRERAYDLIGETILRAWESFHRLRDPQAFVSWLFTTASRLARRQRWRGRLFGQYDEERAAELHSHTSPPDSSADVAALYDALSRLPHKQREAIVLFELNGLTLAEVLEVQGGTLSALKVRLHRGRKSLAELLGVIPHDENILQSPPTSSDPLHATHPRNTTLQTIP